MKKIEKLELKHICGYLPHRLKALNLFDEQVEILGLSNGNESVSNELWSFISHGDRLWGYLYECKPLLLPLSALTELMEDGSVPIKIIKNLPCQYISFRNNVPSIWNGDYWTESISELPLCVIEYLYSIHADIYGLIPAGLAFDKRTVKL